MLDTTSHPKITAKMIKSTPRLLAALALTAAGFNALPAGAANVCTAIADAASGAMLVKQGDCSSRASPASTFKIAISLMGYDSGVLKDLHAPVLPFQPGYVDWRAEWRQPTDPARWMKYSVIWYSQQSVHALGEARFQRYAGDFNYGNHDVSGNPGKHDGMDWAWINSSLRISPQEQLTFLRKLVNHQLPVSKRAVEMTSQLLLQEQRPGGWEIHGKTGSGSPVKADGGYDESRNSGWFVGWAIKDGRTVVFARLIDEAPNAGAPAGVHARDTLLEELPALLAAPLQ